MRIGMIYDRVRLDEKLIINSIKERNIDFELIDAKNLSLDLTNKNELDDDIYLQRCVSTFRGLYVTKVLEEQGLRVVNDFRTSSACLDKIESTLKLSNAGIPVPETHLCFTIESAMKTLEKMGYPAVLKPIFGSWSRLVAILKDPQSARCIFEDRENMGVLYRIFYIQRFIDKPNRDIRVTVVGDEAVACIYRVSNVDFRTNTARGGTAKKCEITRRIEEISLKAARTVGNGVFGVDLMEEGEKLFVCELNHSPEFKNIQRVTGVDVSGKIVDYLVDETKR